MFVRNLSRNSSPQKKLHISMCLSLFFFHFCRKEKKQKACPQSWKRGEEGKEDGGRCCDDRGQLGLRCPFFPLRGVRAYWCKMALCLSETPASWTELSWSNALWDKSVKLFLFCCFCLPAAQPWFCSFLISSCCHIWTVYLTLSGVLHRSWCRCVYSYAVSLPLLLLW